MNQVKLSHIVISGAVFVFFVIVLFAPPISEKHNRSKSLISPLSAAARKKCVSWELELKPSTIESSTEEKIQAIKEFQIKLSGNIFVIFGTDDLELIQGVHKTFQEVILLQTEEKII